MNNFFTKKNIITIVVILLAILSFAFLFTNMQTMKMGDLSEKSGENIFAFETVDDSLNFNNYNFIGMLTKIMAILVIVGAVAVIGFGIASIVKPSLTKFLKIAIIALAVFAVVYFIGGISLCQSVQKMSDLIETSILPGIGIVLPFAFGLAPVIGIPFIKE